MDYKKVNDYEVMYLIRENDEEAKGLLYKKYGSVIKKIALKYLDFASKHGVEFDDLVQEGYIAFFQAVETYDENGGALFFSYVSLCVNRHLITYCRNLCSKKHFILNNSISDDSIVEIKDEFSNPENIFLDRLAEDRFIYYKNHFDVKYSSVLELRYNGFSYKEISTLLDIPISTVDGRIYRIRKYFKQKGNNFC